MRYPTLALALILLPFAAMSQPFAEDDHVLRVSGIGTVIIEPDFGTLRMNVTGQAATIAEAKAITDRIAGAFVEKVEELGVESSDIRSDPMTSRPSRDRDGRLFINYARDTTLILRDLSDLEAVEAAAIEVGITNINNIEYGHSEMSRLQDEALQNAFDAARHEAELAAEATGLTLGRVLSIDVDQRQTGSPPPGVFRMAEAAANIRTGTQEITRTVRVAYRIVE